MLKRKALMESISSNLNGFLKKIAHNLSVPDKKFLHDSLIGLIRCGKPIVCQMARHLPNHKTKDKIYSSENFSCLQIALKILIITPFLGLFHKNPILFSQKHIKKYNSL